MKFRTVTDARSEVCLFLLMLSMFDDFLQTLRSGIVKTTTGQRNNYGLINGSQQSENCFFIRTRYMLEQYGGYGIYMSDLHALLNS